MWKNLVKTSTSERKSAYEITTELRSYCCCSNRAGNGNPQLDCQWSNEPDELVSGCVPWIVGRGCSLFYVYRTNTKPLLEIHHQNHKMEEKVD